MQVVGVVLAGGRSSRMGRDKALLEVQGVAMAVRVATALAEGGCRHVWCQGGDIAGLAAAGLDVVPDDRPGEGPVPAIATALATAAPDSVVVAACDLPDLDGNAVAELLAAADAVGAPVVAAADVGGEQHLLSVWRPQALPALTAAIADGVRSYRHALERLGAATVELPAAVLRNVNTPNDLPGNG